MPPEPRPLGGRDTSEPGTPATSPAIAPRSTVRALARMYPWARPALPRLVMGGVCALGASLLALAVPQVLRGVVNGPLLSAGDSSDVLLAAGLVALLGIVEALLIWGRRMFVANPATTAEREMRTDSFRHLLGLPIAFHDRWGGGQLLSRAMSDLSTIRRWFAFGLIMLVVSLVTIVAGLALVLATSWQLGLVYLAGAVPMVWLGFRFRTAYASAARLARDQAGDLASTVEESVHGIRVLKAFGRGEDALADFVQQASELRETEIVKAQTLARVSFALGAIPEAVLALSLALGLWLAATDRLSVGALVAYFATAAVINRPVEGLSMLLAMTLDARAASDRYFEVAETTSWITDPERPLDLPPAHPAGTRVELRGVVVQFADAATPVLDGVDLALEAGRTTALVGLTGSGKSTLLQLVPRLHDVAAGQVLLDGVDVRDLTVRDVRTCVATAFEDPVLFSASIRDNVLLGVSDGASDADERLAVSLEVSQAQFAYDLPDGVETVVGEEGMSLSGGQRQRIALARAIAGRPRVLVLDDPLSALDVATEAAVTRRLREVLPGTTTLVVAHRPSTVALADRVAVLEGGRITGYGTHSELMARHDHYRYVLTAMDSDEPGQVGPAGRASASTAGDR